MPRNDLGGILKHLLSALRSVRLPDLQDKLRQPEVPLRTPLRIPGNGTRLLFRSGYKRKFMKNTKYTLHEVIDELEQAAERPVILSQYGLLNSGEFHEPKHRA